MSQLYIPTHTHIYILLSVLLSITVYHRMLNIVPCATVSCLIVSIHPF